MTHAALAGDWKRARELHLQLFPLARAVFLETNPIPDQGSDGDDGHAGAGVPAAHVPDERGQPRSCADPQAVLASSSTGLVQGADRRPSAWAPDGGCRRRRRRRPDGQPSRRAGSQRTPSCAWSPRSRRPGTRRSAATRASWPASAGSASPIGADARARPSAATASSIEFSVPGGEPRPPAPGRAARRPRGDRHHRLLRRAARGDRRARPRARRSCSSPNMSVAVNVAFQRARRHGPRCSATTTTSRSPRSTTASRRTRRAAPRCAWPRWWPRRSGRDLAKAAVYGRQGLPGERTRQEIGMMSLRSGDVVGEHTVSFGDARRAARADAPRAQPRHLRARRAARGPLHRRPAARPLLHADVLGLA